jgi:hypothetical protein
MEMAMDIGWGIRLTSVNIAFRVRLRGIILVRDTRHIPISGTPQNGNSGMLSAQRHGLLSTHPQQPTDGNDG